MAISLDNIIPYPSPLPPKPAQSFRIKPLPSKPPPLIHPLPKNPYSRKKSPSCSPSHHLYQPRRDFISSPVIEESICSVLPDPDLFDRALEAWSAVVDTVPEHMGRQQDRESYASQTADIINAGQQSDVRIETTRPAIVNVSRADSPALDFQSADTPTWPSSVALQGNESPVILSVPDQLNPNDLPSSTSSDESLPTLHYEEGGTFSRAGSIEEIPSYATYEATAEVAHFSELQTPQICQPWNGSEVLEMNRGADSLESVPTDVADPAATNVSHASSWDLPPQSAETATQPPDVHVRDCAPKTPAIVNVEDESEASTHSCEALQLEANSIMQDDDDRENSNSSPGDRANKETVSDHTRAPPASTSCTPRRLRSHAKSTVVVVIPKAPPAKPRVSTTLGKRKYRSGLPEESDDPDNSDDEDYIDTTQHTDGERRPTKRPRQRSITDGDQSTSKNLVESRPESLTLPDLRTIAQGTLTCEVFPDHILYLFSWTEKRATADHLLKENVPGRARCAPELSKAREAGSGTVRKVQRGSEWTEGENARLIQLVEEDGLSWSKVKKRFPRRTQEEIKLQYDKIKIVV